jgi:hypothetical protein
VETCAEEIVLISEVHIKRIFRTFGAASNKKLRTNLFQSTTWMLFGKSRKVDCLNRADY